MKTIVHIVIVIVLGLIISMLCRIFLNRIQYKIDNDKKLDSLKIINLNLEIQLKKDKLQNP